MSLGLILHVFIFALAFLTAAYLVFAAAQKSEGLLKPVGTILAVVLAALGALVLIGHLSAPMTGGRPFGIDMEHRWGGTPMSPLPSSGAVSAPPSESAKPAAGAGGADQGGGEGGGKP